MPLHPPGMVVKQAADVLITSHVVRHTRGGVPRLGTGANLGFRSKGAGFRVRELGIRGKEMKGGLRRLGCQTCHQQLLAGNV